MLMYPAAFTLINDKSERHFVKFVYTPELGVHSLVWDEALKLAGQDPDYHRRDLIEAIANRCYPKWKFGVQVIKEEDQHKFDFDILDATKIWPEDLIPVRNIGEFVLNRNVDEFFPETEQVAFCTSHVIPGIGFSDDPLLQGRNFSYFDTQISRLGVNFAQLPINKPVCPFMNFNRDGAQNHHIHKGTVNYWPNRFDATPHARQTGESGAYHEFRENISGMKERMHAPKFKEHYNQAQLFYNSLSPHEKIHLQGAFAFELSHCEDPIVYKRMTERLTDVDLSLAQSVAKMVGGEVPETAKRQNHGKTAPRLSQTEFFGENPTIVSRRIAMLIADGFDLATFTAVRAAFKSLGAITFAIAPRRHLISPGFGPAVMADNHLESMRSTLFDAVFICPGAQSILTLRENGRAVQWAREAFGHLKAIGALGDGVSFLQEAVLLPGVDLAIDQASGKIVTSYGVVTGWNTDAGVLKSLSIEPSETAFSSAFAYAISQHRCYEREMDGLVKKIAF